MRNIALFDLDHTLLPIDSDYEWGQFLARTGAVDAKAFERRNREFFAQYQAGTLDPVEYLEFALGTLAQFPRSELDAMHEEFMDEVIRPALLQPAHDLVQSHLDDDDLVVIITATNRFVTAPIAHAFGVEHLIAAEPELDAAGNITGKLLGVPTSGAGKVTHLQQWLAQQGMHLDDFPRSYFYSDSQNDIPLLSIVTDPIATNPNTKLRAHAETQGWPIIHLFDEQ
ncbi:HAD family hydrolase [Undibacterium sp. 5I1]|uniref:histidinol-phosphatase n=1 Tax=unclassified Undibacterium TaxID=2630295 RepID=UPI002AB49210|nr:MULTISPECIES: HAD family hydrolase [unclassified Undibacterium]MDY7540438.1 HAD family hydrolase [Undibacterium sp. 5I1]MEB0230101.1 HAD family hydrolase [Undibacterium sp. 10I3]MEB0257697.1 HAD family hydrolase [Undibacterium sp. 5I1]